MLPNYTDFEVEPPREATTQSSPDSMLQLLVAHQGRLVHKWLHYPSAYDHELRQYRNSTVRLLELGVSHGGSLELWRQYLGDAGTIYGIDIDVRCASLDTKDNPVRIGSQTDAQFLRGLVAEMGGIDVVVDDGSHIASDQRTSFEVLFPLLADGGVYVVEDLHTAYWSRFEGGYRRHGSFIEFSKDLVDGMHAWYYWRRPAKRARFAATEVESVTFYDSMVFIRKHHHGRPTHTNIGTPSW